MSKTLHLTLKKQWFDLILSGEKKEECREIKPYWTKRLMREHELGGHYALKGIFKHFDTITFTNGYAKNSPVMEVECLGISIGTGNPDRGGGNETFIIKLGNIISTKNISTHPKLLTKKDK